jgi:hypothetical protein
VLQPLEQRAEKLLGRLRVPAALHQDIQHIVVLIYRVQLFTFSGPGAADCRPVSLIAGSDAANVVLRRAIEAQNVGCMYKPSGVE